MTIYLSMFESINLHGAYFSRMRSKGSRFTWGCGGIELCSPDVAFTFATVRKPFASVRVRAVWPCL